MQGTVGLFRRFEEWLAVRQTWGQYLQLIALVFAFEIFWVVAQGWIVHWLGIPKPQLDPEFEKFIEKLVA
ncbi:MAG: hypothetical protein RIQ56_501, partial [Candidatus Parcubacteria bacterium]